MLDSLIQLGGGFLACMTPLNLAVLTIGIIVGLLIGVLPGLTLVMGVILALPFTYKMDITPSVILLTAMYVSGTYGGAFTAILFKVPGEPIDVPLLWDGYTMARNGDPAKALGWTLVAALLGGLLSAIVMVLLTKPIADLALRFDTPDKFAIILFGLASVVALAGGRLAPSLISLAAGLLIATVGTDETFGAQRFTGHPGGLHAEGRGARPADLRHASGDDLHHLRIDLPRALPDGDHRLLRRSPAGEDSRFPRDGGLGLHRRHLHHRRLVHP
jgi:putative tricarboxylic transport membrane protein